MWLRSLRWRDPGRVRRVDAPHPPDPPTSISPTRAATCQTSSKTTRHAPQTPTTSTHRRELRQRTGATEFARANFWRGRVHLGALAWETTEQLGDIAAADARIDRATAQAERLWAAAWSRNELLCGGQPLRRRVPAAAPAPVPALLELQTALRRAASHVLPGPHHARAGHARLGGCGAVRDDP